MPRRKLTEAEKEERRRNMALKQKVQQLESELRELNREYKVQTRLGEPTRFWELGDRVKFGSHPNAEVQDIAEVDGTPVFYLLRVWGEKRAQHGTEMVPYEVQYWRPWWELEDELSLEDRGPPMSYREDVNIVYSNRGITGLLHMHYSGLDYEPEYQRGHIWKMGQRVALIDSIYNNIDIGKFTFINRGYDCVDRPYREVLDGKQRLTTLIMFYEDRFLYRGKLFSGMHPQDQAHFEHYQALVAEAEGKEMTREQKLRYFLKLNTAGAPQDPEHIAKVKELWRHALKEEKR